jgi:hypothetical protein
LDICSTSIIWSGIPLSSTLHESKPVVRGYILRASFAVDYSYSCTHISLERDRHHGNNDSIGRGRLDFETTELQSSIWCLHIATVISLDSNPSCDDHGKFIVMMIQPVADFQDTYRRVGLGEISSENQEGKDLYSFNQRFLSRS